MDIRIKKAFSVLAAVVLLITALCPAASFAAGGKNELAPLAAPAPYWSVLSPGTVCWNPVPGAAGYNWQLYYGDNMLVDSGYIASVSGVSITYTLSLIGKIRAGSYGAYTVYVQAAADPKSTVYKSGDFGKTEYLNYSVSGYSTGATAAPAPYWWYPVYGYNYLWYLYFNNIRCTLDIHKYTGCVGDTKQINVSVNTPYRVDVEWTSSDENVATVDSNGLVTLVGPGVAVITAADAFAGSDTCTVTVKKSHIIKLN